MTAISFDQVSKRYSNGVAAVRELNLEIAAGEFVVLVGPSGCGKTTTLRLIAGLEQPTSGTLRLGGRVVNHTPPRDRDVGIVFQQPALYPHLTVRDNLAFGLAVRQSPGRLARLLLRLSRPQRARTIAAEDQAREVRVSEAATLLELSEVLERFPSQLSGGQQQRAALGRALVRQPSVYLFDEPLSNLDGPLRAEMRRQLHLLHRRLPATMVYVTHDPVEALSLADRVVVLRDGTVQQADAPLTVYDRPSNRFVAGFVGWPPMSFLEGTVGDSGGRRGLVQGANFLPLPAGNAESVADRAVSVGIRPEAVSLERARASDANLAMRLVVLEPIGANALATFMRDSWELTALLPRHAAAGLAEDGRDVELYLDMTQVHLFDRESGAALAEAAAPAVRRWTADG